MKKWFVAIITGIVGLAGGVRIVTKKKQKVARYEGIHIPYGPYEAVIKRPLDIVLSGIGLAILSPVLLVIAVLVRVKLGSPVLFKQKRPGIIDSSTRTERIFYIYKFRTMTDERTIDGELMPDEARLTSFGRKLRSLSLDELPELINILKGDMAIVGPRPQLVRDMAFMNEEQRKRHSVYPGLTGLAQVSGRNAISWNEKLKKDLEYVEKITFIRDCSIIVKTLLRVASREGINEEGNATATDYGDWLLLNNIIDKNTYINKNIEANRILGDKI